MINPNNFTVDANFTKLEQRVLDVLIEKHLFNRFIIHKPETVDLDKLKTYRGAVSFVEPIHFQSQKERFADFKPRLVPYYSRAEESCVHLIKTKLNEMGYMVSTTRTKAFTSTHLIKQGHQNARAEAVHLKSTISLSVAVARLVLSQNELLEQFKKYSRLIKRT